MLVLTRRIGETLVIGEDGTVTATILGIKGNQVKIGVNAPKDVPVHREEIFRRILSEQGQVVSGSNIHTAETATVSEEDS